MKPLLFVLSIIRFQSVIELSLIHISCVLDDNGTLLWSTGLGHPDKIYLTDIDPDRPGMEVFLGLEPWHENGRGVCVVDARTGQPVWNIPASNSGRDGKAGCTTVSNILSTKKSPLPAYRVQTPKNGR